MRDNIYDFRNECRPVKINIHFFLLTRVKLNQKISMRFIAMVTSACGIAIQLDLNLMY